MVYPVQHFTGNTIWAMKITEITSFVRHLMCLDVWIQTSHSCKNKSLRESNCAQNVTVTVSAVSNYSRLNLCALTQLLYVINTLNNTRQRRNPAQLRNLPKPLNNTRWRRSPARLNRWSARFDTSRLLFPL